MRFGIDSVIFPTFQCRRLSWSLKKKGHLPCPAFWLQDNGGSMGAKGSILETVIALVLLGILAGAVGGLGVGLVTGRSPSGSSTSTQ